MSAMADIWESYVAKVLPSDAPEVQVFETRRAFYSGALAIVSLADNEAAFAAAMDDVERTLGGIIAADAVRSGRGRT